MTLKYKIRFYDYWHLSSGLSAGAKLDSTVTKDKNGMPYVPAKTIKGLLREMAETLKDSEFIKDCFGDEGTKQGRCYFANASFGKNTAKEIVSNKLQDNLYDIIASTKIGANGIAEDNSLREIEVVIPLTLEGEILDIPSEDDAKKLIDVMKLIKRMGLNRNRGLGRCEFLVEDLT
ncbi:MAG: RAMP superfamily CRISPR-associated protein [Sulfurimonas sp.]|nr:RAMP superfamily CRISPR-associated protein [Sulfurimonas sp.]